MTGQGIRMIRFALAAMAVAVVHQNGVASAFASPERHIPRGELSPQVIEKVYDSPRGEVQFTVVEQSGNRSAFLRNTKGILMTFTEVRGGRDCETWFLSAKGDSVPRGCEFLFYDQMDGRYLSVRSEELEESTIFDLTSDALHAFSQDADARGSAHVSL